MKTFEERYTAWIDGQLAGPALRSFELELSRRASAGEARADKEDAARLHRLLVTNLQAPALTNAEFFSHQLRERIDAERATERRRVDARQARWSLFTWPFARLAGLGAAGAFVAIALYYGTMPPRSTTPGNQVASNTTPMPAPGVSVPDMKPDPALAVQTTRHSSENIVALVTATPPPVDLNADIQVLPVPGSSMNTSATPLHLKDPNVSVLWINGLDYMPNVPGDASANAAPSPAGGATP